MSTGSFFLGAFVGMFFAIVAIVVFFAWGARGDW